MAQITEQRIEDALRQVLEDDPDFELVEALPEQRWDSTTLDLVARIKTPAPDQVESILLIEVKSKGAPSSLAPAIDQLQRLDLDDAARRFGVETGMVAQVVAAPFISERGRALCKEEGVGYLDLAGNCFFKTGAYYFQKEGRENPVREKRIAKSLFADKASRISRALLEEPDRAWTLTELAETLEVSVGYVHAVVKKLEEEGFASRNQDYQVVLEEPAELLDYWARIYDVTEQETHTYYTFQRGVDPFLDQIKQAEGDVDGTYALTLHAGASRVAPFTRFNETHLYVRREDLDRWVEALDLRPVESGGNVHLILAFDDGVFYRAQELDGLAVVCNTQLYLDLYNYPARGREQADHLREERIPY